MISNPWGFGDAHSDFTGAAVVENVADASAAYTLAWDKAVKGAFVVIKEDGTNYVLFDERKTYTAEQLATKTTKDVKIIASSGTVTFADLDSDGKVPASALSANCRVAYYYDNVVVPQNDLPMIKAEMKSIALVAKARRIAVENMRLN